MDAILIDPSLKQRRKSSEFHGDDDEKSESGTVRRSGGLLNAMQAGVGGSTARKTYSLAPCHHLFVRIIRFFYCTNSPPDLNYLFLCAAYGVS